MLRECIKQVVTKVKTDFPNNQVRVNVDTQRLCLTVARREKKPDNPGKWNSYDLNIPLPKEALNIDIRSVPEGFKLHTLPAGPRNNSRRKSSSASSSASETQVMEAKNGV
jgi:hypothetical protein